MAAQSKLSNILTIAIDTPERIREQLVRDEAQAHAYMERITREEGWHIHWFRIDEQE